MGRPPSQDIFKQEDLNVIGASLLQRDVTGRHALDYAVAGGHVPTLLLMLKAVWASVPPRGRSQLMDTPHDGVPCFLLELARLHPRVLAEVLEESQIECAIA